MRACRRVGHLDRRRYSCLYDSQGRNCGHIGLQQDVTTRSSRALAGLHGTIVHQLSDAIIVTDAMFRITLVNSAARRCTVIRRRADRQKAGLLNAQPDALISQQDIMIP
jgi:PAS domain-containing protein